MANSDQEPQKDLPSNPPRSDTVKEADGQMHKRKRAWDGPSTENGQLRSLHSID